LPKNYRSIQQWNHWLSQSLGHLLIQAEQEVLIKLLDSYFGKHGLFVGVPAQEKLFHSTVTAQSILLTPLLVKHQHYKIIESDFYELPIRSGSVELVVLPHTLEHITNPQKLLSEACRIVKPEGHIIILGFNPLSLWGRKFKSILPGKVRKWLSLEDFELVRHENFLFRPPTQKKNLFHNLRFLETVGQKFLKPFGGVYVLIAKAKVIPLTPIRLRWKQHLSGLGVPSMMGPSMRDYTK